METVRVKATPEEIARVAKNISGLANTFDEYTRLLGQASNITGAWGGEGSEDYLLGIDNCLVELKKMTATLNDTSTTLQPH